MSDADRGDASGIAVCDAPAGETSFASLAGRDPRRKAAASARRRRRGWRELGTDILYAGPQYVIYVGLAIVPFLIALPIVFTDQINFLDADIDWVGFENIASLFQEPLAPRFFDAFRRTVMFSVINYAVSLTFGFLLALAMYELASRLKGLIFTIIYLPWMVSGIGIGLMMIMLFASDTGVVNLALEELGLGRNLIDVKSETAAIVALPFMYAWKAAGFNMAIFLGGLLAVPPETIESARMDGANYVRRVFHIYIPQIVPSIVIVTVFSMINSFGIFDELVGLGALGGNTNAEFLSIFIYQLGFGSSTTGGVLVGTLAQAVTISLVVFLPLVVVAFFLTRLQKNLDYR